VSVQPVPQDALRMRPGVVTKPENEVDCNEKAPPTTS